MYLIIISPLISLADEEPSYVGVIFNNPTKDWDVLEFFSEDKKSTLVLNSKGLFIDDRLICGWGSKGLGIDYKSIEDSCPNDSPIRDGSYYNMGGFEPAGLYYTAIRIVHIKDSSIKIPYNNKIYSGSLPIREPIKVFPGKGTKIEKQIQAEHRKMIANRVKELDDIGLSETLNSLKKCLHPKIITKTCFKNYLPTDDEKFIISGPGYEDKYTLDELYRKLKAKDKNTENYITDTTLFSDLLNCINKNGPKYQFENSSRDKVIIFHDDWEWNWGTTCIFKQKNGKWIFSEIRWWGC